MSKSSFEEILERDGKLIYSNVGTSMWPLVRPGRDLLVIERRKGRLHRLDVALYRRDSGQYVLHRVLRVLPNGYVICGDNQWRPERGITDAHVIGVLTAVVRNGREVPMSSWYCRAYAHLWCDPFPVRAAAVLIGGTLRRRMKRLRHGR